MKTWQVILISIFCVLISSWSCFAQEMYFQIFSSTNNDGTKPTAKPCVINGIDINSEKLYRLRIKPTLRVCPDVGSIWLIDFKQTGATPKGNIKGIVKSMRKIHD